MSDPKYQQLKEQPTGTKEGIVKLGNVYTKAQKSEFTTPDERVELAIVLVRARGRIIADLIRKGEIQEDEQADLMRGFSKTITALSQLKRGERPQAEIVEESLEFIRRHGE